MPNRRDLAMPRARAESRASASDDAWTIIGLCAIGWLMSLYFAVSHLGIDAVPRLMAQFPGAM